LCAALAVGVTVAGAAALAALAADSVGRGAACGGVPWPDRGSLALDALGGTLGAGGAEGSLDAETAGGKRSGVAGISGARTDAAGVCDATPLTCASSGHRTSHTAVVSATPATAIDTGRRHRGGAIGAAASSAVAKR
jgi:hypothetical protein